MKHEWINQRKMKYEYTSMYDLTLIKIISGW